MGKGNGWLLILMLVLAAASVVGCGCGDDDDDDSGGGDDDTGDDDSGDDDADDDSDDDADDDADDDDVGPECIDLDGDTYGENCEAGPDCNDNDPNAFVVVTGYVDEDGDGYAGTGVDLCTNGVIPPEYMTQAEDCDDEDITTHPGAVDFPDDGIDQDCDEADALADEDTGYFVDDAGGSDSNDGTKDDPFATVQKAMTESALNPDKPNIYIAEGTYTEDTMVPANTTVRLYGGYDPDTWTRDVKAPTVLEADLMPYGLRVDTNGSVLIHGMTIEAASSGAGIGIFTATNAAVAVIDSDITAGPGSGTKAGIYMLTGSALDVHRCTIELGESSDDAVYGIYGAYLAISISDTQILGGGSPSSDSFGLYVMAAGGTVTDTSISLGDSDGGIGALINSSGLAFRNTTMDVGDAGTQNFGLYALTSNVLWDGGSISLGDAPTGTNMAVNSSASNLTINGVSISTGEADSLNVGVYAVGGIPGSRTVLMNDLVTTGDANDTNYGIMAASIETVIGQSTVVAGSGDVTRTALYLVMGGTEFFDPMIFNNHFGSGPSAGDAFVALMPAGAPFRKVVFVGNNLYGNVDALVHDGTNMVTDIDDVNACDFDSCRQAVSNLNENPDFAGGSDFHPDAGSPLIDAGVNPIPYLSPADQMWVWHDLSGSPRPFNGAWDIGAYEVD